MQPAPGGSGLVSRGGGLSRFYSAPASWLEALLEDEEEDPLKPTQCLTDLLADNSGGPTLRSSTAVGFASDTADPAASFARQNSSPADFIGSSSDGSEGYFSGFGIPANLDYVSNPNFSSVSPSSSANKRVREVVSKYLIFFRNDSFFFVIFCLVSLIVGFQFLFVENGGRWIGGVSNSKG